MRASTSPAPSAAAPSATRSPAGAPRRSEPRTPSAYLNRLSDLLFILARCANAGGAKSRSGSLAPRPRLRRGVRRRRGRVHARARARHPAAAADPRRPTGNASAAAGTNIAISAAAWAGAGGLRHARAGRVDWHVVTWLAPPSIDGRDPRRAGSPAMSRKRLLDAAIAAVLVWSGIDLVAPAGARARTRAAAALARGRRRARHRRARRRRRRHPRDAADADARCVASGWTSGGRPGRTSSSASSSASPASRRTRARAASTGRSCSPGSPARSRAAGSVRRATGRIDETVLRLALGAVLVVVGVAFAVEAAV